MALITQNQTLRYLVSALESGGSTADAIKAFFTPFCTHSVADWLKTQITANAADVVGKVATLVAAPAPVVLTVQTNAPVLGMLISSYCTATHFVCDYADGLGGVTTVLREPRTSAHPC